ncbi:hypothetical protein GCM10010320_72700 [Streptomyces caelestis]|nr:hypothetical protein GCM10010320_72700 [Streptomyces caelestis]
MRAGMAVQEQHCGAAAAVTHPQLRPVSLAARQLEAVEHVASCASDIQLPALKSWVHARVVRLSRVVTFAALKWLPKREAKQYVGPAERESRHRSNKTMNYTCSEP